MKRYSLLDSYERKKQLEREKKLPKQSRLQLKDYITISLSLVALGLSAITAYYTILRVIERLEVTLIQAPEIRMTEDQKATWTGSLGLAFVNNGNAPIAVADAAIVLFPSKRIEDEEECIGDAEPVELSLVTEPFVVKPSEIITKSLAPTEAERQQFALNTQVKPGEWFHLIACLQLRFVTSRGGQIDSRSFGAWPRNDAGAPDGVPGDFYPIPVRRIPMVFANQSKLRFWSDE